MSERLNKEQIKHDRFIDEIEVAYESMQRNRTRLIGIAVALLVLGGIIAAIYGYQTKRENDAQVLLGDAISTLEKPLAGEQGAAPDAPKTEEDRSKKAEGLFRQVIEKYSGRDAADVASLYVAQMEVARGDLKSAQPKLEAFLQSHSDHMLAGAAQMSLYQIQLAGGQAQQVVNDINTQLAAESPRVPKDALLGLLAKAYEAQGQEAKAKEAYQRVINEYPNSPYAIDAQRKVARG